MFKGIARAFDATTNVMESHTALTIVAFIALLAYQGYSLFMTQQFDVAAFGQALGVVLGGGGAVAFGQGFLNRSRGSNVRPDSPE